MRFVDRSAFPLPPSLADGALRDRRRYYYDYLTLPEAERAQTRPPDQAIGKDVQDAVIEPLTELFGGKCSFCEQSIVPLKPYRFRPPSNAYGFPSADTPDSVYYGWLAYAWQNLYLICDGCRPKVPNFFPVLGPRMPIPTPADYQEYLADGRGLWLQPLEETPEILDPCGGHKFQDHFSAAMNGVLDPITPEAKYTIDLFSLNRDDLVARRKEAAQRELEVRQAGSPLAKIDDDTEFSAFLTELFSPVVDDDLIETFSISSDTQEDESRLENLKSIPQADQPPHYDVETVEITDFRALEHVRLSLPPRPEGNLARALLILGENATGKSTLLEAISLTLLNDAARGLLVDKPHKLFLNPKYMGSDAARKSMARVKLTLSGPKGDVKERTLTVTTSGGMQVEGDPFPDNYPVFGYGAYRHYQQPIRRWRPDRAVRNLFRSDDLLSNPEKWLISLDDGQRRMVIMALRIIIGGGFSTIDVKDGECFVVMRDKPQADDPASREAGRVISSAPLDTLSSGFRTILALCCDMMRWLMERDGFTAFEYAKGLCVIDEVEAHLHPRWKVSIMSGLRRAFPAMTFIVTTHDPLCIRGMKNGEVMVLQRLERDRSDTDLPVFVDTLTTLPDVTQLTIEQLLSSDLFDLFDTTDVDTGRDIAQLADILSRWRSGQSTTDAAEQAILDKFQSEVLTALPIGATEVSRVVEEAVADFLIERRGKPSSERQAMRQKTKDKIIAALGGL